MGKSIFRKCLVLFVLPWLLIDTKASLAQISVTSKYWAGYAVSEAAYSDVYASWVVPQVDCSSVAAGTKTLAIAWVGLSGDLDDTITQNVLEQIGTGQGCNGTTPDYLLFYEFYPEQSQFGDSRYHLTPGDTVVAKVSRNADGTYTLSETATAKDAKSPKWTFSTTGSSTGTSISNPGNRAAEIVMEQTAPSADSTRMGVARYGSITFFNIGYTKASAVIDHTTSFQFYQPLEGNTLATQWATPVTLSPTSFIVYQY